MAVYSACENQAEIINLVNRLSLHHDHLKTLVKEYSFMRQEETYARMLDTNFQFDLLKMNECNTSYYTSLIVKLEYEQNTPLFDKLDRAYKELEKMVKDFYPASQVEIFHNSAHITIKSILDGFPQNEAELRMYLPVVRPIVNKWISQMGQETELYGIGLFTNLHKDKGLSVGVKWFPTLPLFQLIRGEVGVDLYRNHQGLRLRPEARFHTMLTHSTGFRARHLECPLNQDFFAQFKKSVEDFDKQVFGRISHITAADISLRNGFSDKLITKAEISIA
jgi:hypothetical protein